MLLEVEHLTTEFATRRGPVRYPTAGSSDSLARGRFLVPARRVDQLTGVTGGGGQEIRIRLKSGGAGRAGRGIFPKNGGKAGKTRRSAQNWRPETNGIPKNGGKVGKTRRHLQKRSGGEEKNSPSARFRCSAPFDRQSTGANPRKKCRIGIQIV